jgi:hypothetical protein
MEKHSKFQIPSSSQKTLMILLCGLLLISCTSPTESNDDNNNSNPSKSLTIDARPSAIPADGASRMTLFIEYREDGIAVPDSTRVILLNPMGTLAHGTIYTIGGVALDTLTADSTAGIGWLVAYADGLRDSIEIMFTDTTN